MRTGVFIAVSLSISLLSAVNVTHGDDFEDFALGVLGELGVTGFECPGLLYTEHCAYYGSADFSSFEKDWERAVRGQLKPRSLQRFTAWRRVKDTYRSKTERRFYRVYRRGNDLVYVFFDPRWQTVSILYPPSSGSRDEPGPWVENTMGVTEPERIYDDSPGPRNPVTVDITGIVLGDGSLGEIISIEGDHTLPPGAEDKAVERARQWSYKPALKRGRPVDAYAWINVSFESTDKAKRPIQEERVDPGEIYTGWGVSRKGDYLLPSDTDVLSLTVYDPGSRSVIDDEVWRTVVVEIPELENTDLPLVVETSFAFVRSCGVFFECSDRRFVDGQVALLEKTETGVLARFELEFEGLEIKRTAEFSPDRPSVGLVRRIPVSEHRP